MKITYLSHSCFEVKNDRTVLIDPYFTGNKLAPEYEGKPDLILVTHEHYDHSDVKKFDVMVVCPPNCKFRNARHMKIGDKATIKMVKIEMVSASHHQSEYATGYIFEIDGKRLYHAGDTYLDGIKPQENIDVFFVPIGGIYTMNVDEAVKAVRIIKPKLAIPMHYNTFPQIKADPEEFKEKVEKEGFRVRVLKIGETIEV